MMETKSQRERFEEAARQQWGKELTGLLFWSTP